MIREDWIAGRETDRLGHALDHLYPQASDERTADMYGGANWDYQNDPALYVGDDDVNRCIICDEPGEEYIGGNVYCEPHAVRAGRR